MRFEAPCNDFCNDTQSPDFDPEIKPIETGWRRLTHYRGFGKLKLKLVEALSVSSFSLKIEYG